MEQAELGATFENCDDFLACTLCGGQERRELEVSLDKRTPWIGMQDPSLCFHTESFKGNKTAISHTLAFEWSQIIYTIAPFSEISFYLS
jgi:hypothetical protein